MFSARLTVGGELPEGAEKQRDGLEKHRSVRLLTVLLARFRKPLPAPSLQSRTRVRIQEGTVVLSRWCCVNRHMKGESRGAILTVFMSPCDRLKASPRCSGEHTSFTYQGYLKYEAADRRHLRSAATRYSNLGCSRKLRFEVIGGVSYTQARFYLSDLWQALCCSGRANGQ